MNTSSQSTAVPPVCVVESWPDGVLPCGLGGAAVAAAPDRGNAVDSDGKDVDVDRADTAGPDACGAAAAAGPTQRCGCCSPVTLTALLASAGSAATLSALGRLMILRPSTTKGEGLGAAAAAGATCDP